LQFFSGGAPRTSEAPITQEPSANIGFLHQELTDVWLWALPKALPLTSGARRRAGIDPMAAAALFVRRAALVAPSTSQVIGETFKLTPTELRVLLAIVEVGGIPEVTTAFGVADTTVRTHVNRLFEKTGVTRQADLVKIVAGYATMVAE
jgi:DNA-binding CsgD family transcriptional regulator